MFDITATIVLYKTDRDELLGAINSFLNCEKNVHLYLVDNSPTDCLKDLINDGRVEYKFVGENLGYGAAHNLILKSIAGKSKYHLVLNPDIIFEKGTLEVLFQFMEEHLDVGYCTGDIFKPTGERQYACRLLPTPLSLIFRRVLPSFDISKNPLEDFSFDKPINVPWTYGCFMFIRTSIIKDVGCFDPRFFMYCEDLDYARRIHSKYKTIYHNEVKIIHDSHRDSTKSLKMFFVHLVSVIKYFNKWGWFVDKEREQINQKFLKDLL
ncbi:MAG: glycosyltransferase [Paludibacteraceae bacterium]|nr:glycosyltransferase [Bacilli bacterium]MBR6660045.1 glycosyltransferase [Paludibacteraceae bacterium]